MILFSDFRSKITEALDTRQKAEVDSWGKNKNHSFSNHVFGKEKRVHVPLEFPDHKSQHQEKIEAHLEPHGIKVHDYVGGFGTDKHGRQVAIGKALVKTKAESHLVNGFANDPVRQQLKAFKDYHVVVSKHPHDVAGMTSSGHSWENESCMNFNDGSNREYLQQDVKHGTHVAYLVHKDDKDIEKPLARIALKPFVDEDTEHTILRPEHRTYGNAPDAFTHTVNRWVNNHFPGHEDVIYVKHSKVYHDSGDTVALGEKAIPRALKSDNISIKGAALRHPNITPKQVEHVFQRGTDIERRITLGNPKLPVHHLKTTLESDDDLDIHHVLKNPNITSEHIGHFLDRKLSGIGMGERTNYSISDALYHEKISPEHLEKGLTHVNSNIRAVAVRNPITNIHQLERASKDDSTWVRLGVAQHENATPKLIDHILKNDSNEDVRGRAIRNKNASVENISTAMKDKEYYIRDLAIQHPKANLNHIKKALNDPFPNVRHAAIQHHIVTPEIIDMALNNKDDHTRHLAIQHKNASVENLDKALNHHDEYVRINAVQNEKVTPEHIEKSLNDESHKVRLSAILTGKATEEQLKKRLEDPTQVVSYHASRWLERLKDPHNIFL